MRSVRLRTWCRGFHRKWQHLPTFGLIPRSEGISFSSQSRLVPKGNGGFNFDNLSYNNSSNFVPEVYKLLTRNSLNVIITCRQFWRICMAKKMEPMDVLAGTTWPPGSPRHDHYRLYGTKPVSRKNRTRQMVFDGMDGVVINDDPSTNRTGCWADVEARPGVIEGLVGPKGLAFLELLNKKRTRTRYFKTRSHGREKRFLVSFTKLRVVSAWQFTLFSTGGSTRRIVFSALRKHIGMSPKLKNWVLEKNPYHL